MSMSGRHSTRLFMLFGIVLSILAARPALAAQSPITDAKPQTVVILSGRSMVDHLLPPFIQIEPGRFLSTMAVQQACSTPRLKADSLLLFLPDSARCKQLDAQDRIPLRQRLHDLTGRRPVDDPLERLRKQPFLAIVPVPDSSDQARGGCTCAGNSAPTGSVTCTAQTRTADTPIGSVTFIANDADDDTLSATFSHQRDANPVQPDLPSTLTGSCSSDHPGTLQCTIDGTAPAPVGIVQINLLVSDGLATLGLDSLLEILAPVEGRIFADGFEFMGCL